MVEVSCFVELKGAREDVQVIGECRRDFGRIHCEIKKILYADHDVIDVISEPERKAIEARLMCQYIANRHPLGDSIDL